MHSEHWLRRSHGLPKHALSHHAKPRQTGQIPHFLGIPLNLLARQEIPLVDMDVAWLQVCGLYSFIKLVTIQTVACNYFTMQIQNKNIKKISTKSG